MNFFNKVLDILFPVYCLACGRAGVSLCLACLAECPTADRESANWVFPLYDYRHSVVKEAIGLLKYKNRKELAVVFASALYDRILEELAEFALIKNFKEALLIPIPLSQKRLRERGFNQVELICEKLAALDGGINFKLEPKILVKTVETKRQTHVENRSERLKNVINSFAVSDNQNLLKNKNIILIDDVTTTGATLSEAKKALRAAGVRHVIAFTIAH